MLTQKRLKELLHYNPKTGVFIWKKSRGKIQAGTIANSVRPDGYIHIKLDYILYLAHRLAWFYVHGKWPNKNLDHRNRVKHHNWIKNLRNGAQQHNMQNIIKAQSNNVIGVRNVYFDKRRGTYVVSIRVHKKTKYIGAFATLKLAKAAAIKAKKKHHSFCS